MKRELERVPKESLVREVGCSWKSKKWEFSLSEWPSPPQLFLPRRHNAEGFEFNGLLVISKKKGLVPEEGFEPPTKGL